MIKPLINIKYLKDAEPNELLGVSIFDKNLDKYLEPDPISRAEEFLRLLSSLEEIIILRIQKGKNNGKETL